ncbi:MAG: ATP phosphoribosyltransferase [Spirochaetota bacterium]|jgi:ATP phosphoribosyltransferase|nr:ATP phosphoribosyltransferase [Spirochaetales bacterium]MBQ2124266.1 ATP phosphoribosyltransferase [Spirochaetales bacterium]MEE1291344.1 ATP phosphoribosyltransferase [Spirochaetota bacterium]
MEEKKIITIAVPKGRLQEQIAEYLAGRGVTIKEESRKLDYYDEKNGYRFLFVKNSDVPVYVNYGVADLGFSGSDVVYEGDFEFLHLARLPFGGTRICVAGYEKDRPLFEQNGLERSFIKPIKIATKFTRFTNHYFEERGIPVQIIKLTGSVELAPILGLAHFIVDLVETGSTLRENNLAVIEEIGRTHVKLIANPSLYRQNYRKIDDFVSKLQG